MKFDYTEQKKPFLENVLFYFGHLENPKNVTIIFSRFCALEQEKYITKVIILNFFN